MKTPSEFEVEMLHANHGYDPVKAREYYLRTRELKGRKKGSQKVTYEDGSVGTKAEARGKVKWTDPRSGKTMKQIKSEARIKQRKELGEAIQKMEGRLKNLEALIKERASKEKSEDRKGKAKKERAAKENEKPKSAAEKAKAARENEKYRDKNKQKLKSKADKDGKSGGSSKSKTGKGKKSSVSELKSLATKVRGQIAVAKQKLAAL